jgi:hypothetical protein
LKGGYGCGDGIPAAMGDGLAAAVGKPDSEDAVSPWSVGEASVRAIREYLTTKSTKESGEIITFRISRQKKQIYGKHKSFGPSRETLQGLFGSIVLW